VEAIVRDPATRILDRMTRIWTFAAEPGVASPGMLTDLSRIPATDLVYAVSALIHDDC
jgi:hypothetical protein